MRFISKTDACNSLRFAASPIAILMMKICKKKYDYIFNYFTDFKTAFTAHTSRILIIISMYPPAYIFELEEMAMRQTRFRLNNNWQQRDRSRCVRNVKNKSADGMVYLSFNRFRIKGPPLPGHADWQEIARHPARHPKNRYELRRRDKIVSRSCPPIVSFSPLVGIASILRDDSFFLRVMANASTCALGEILRIDTIELSCRKSLFQPSRSPSGRERERAARPASR